jgi:peptidylprolyl isomerase
MWGDTVPDEPIGTPPPPFARPSDGLLGDARLQAIVDLQVERDGAGLIAILQSEEAPLRARAAFALASVQDPEAGSALVNLLRDPDPAVRRDAAFALGQLGEARYGPVLLGAFREEGEPGVRAALLEAAGKSEDPRIVDDLLELDLREGEEAARTMAVARLGIAGASLPTSVQHLLSTLKHPDAAARTAAAYYFGRNSAAGPWAAQAGAVRAVLDSLPPSEPMAMHLLLGLALLGDPQDNPRFLWWMNSSPDWRIRANAARATGGRTGDLRVRQGLMEALTEPSTHVAIYAANSLANVERLAPRELDDLKAWVNAHPEEWLRAGPILALLGRMGEGEFLEAWLARWEDTDVGPRTRGLGALAFVPGDAATQAILEATQTGTSRILGTALGGLARRWRVDRQDPSKVELYYQAFTAGLETGDPAAVFVAAPALADSAFLPLGSLEFLTASYQRMEESQNTDGMQAVQRALDLLMGEEEEEGEGEGEKKKEG